MKLNRDPNGALQRGYQLRCLIGQQKAGHILDTDGIRTHVFNLFCNVGPVVQCVSVAQSIGKGDLCMAFFLVGSLHSRLKVAQVI